MHRAWQGKDIRLCIKSYSSQEVEAMQLLDTKLAEVTNAQKKQRVEDQSDPPFDPGTSTGCTCLPAVWHFTTATHPCLRTCTPLCLCKGSSPFLALCFRKGSSPFLAWPLQNDKIKQTCSSACFSMAAAASPSTCHVVLYLSVHCRAWLRLGLASSLSPTTLCVAVCWTRCAMGTLLQQNLVSGGVKRRGR